MVLVKGKITEIKKEGSNSEPFFRRRVMKKSYLLFYTQLIFYCSSIEQKAATYISPLFSTEILSVNYIGYFVFCPLWYGFYYKIWKIREIVALEGDISIKKEEPIAEPFFRRRYEKSLFSVYYVDTFLLFYPWYN